MDTWWDGTGKVDFASNAQVVKMGKEKKSKNAQKCAKMRKNEQVLSRNRRFLRCLEKGTCAFGAMWTACISNPKFEARNLRWTGETNSNDENTKLEISHP